MALRAERLAPNPSILSALGSRRTARLRGAGLGAVRCASMGIGPTTVFSLESVVSADCFATIADRR